jgi:predicted transcriptional regulator
MMALSEREFMAHLTQARDRLVYLMREASPAQVLELGEVVDGLYRDMRALHDQPKARG